MTAIQLQKNWSINPNVRRTFTTMIDMAGWWIYENHAWLKTHGWTVKFTSDGVTGPIRDAPIEFSGVPGAPPGAYRMRAYDGTLGRIVYWDAIAIDELGSEYQGPGPLTDVVVFMFQGSES